MCGIGFIASGVRITGSLVSNTGEGAQEPSDDLGVLYPTIQDLCGILKSRGPDHVGSETVGLKVDRGRVCPTWQHSDFDGEFPSRTSCPDINAERGTVEAEQNSSAPVLQFVGSSLQLRGDQPVRQPLKDLCKNLLVYNGEIFDGLLVKAEENDGVALLASLQNCCSCPIQVRREFAACCNSETTVGRLLSTIRGPWAVIYWQAEASTLWFGRDAIGRRSLLVHWPSSFDSRLVLSSVAPAQRVVDDSCLGNGTSTSKRVSAYLPADYWEELPPGIYSISLQEFQPRENIVFSQQVNARQFEVQGYGQAHEWEDPYLQKLVSWERCLVVPGSVVRTPPELVGAEFAETEAADRVLKSLQRAVNLRTRNIRDIKYPYAEAPGYRSNEMPEPYTPVAILFSGGLDSMILAALADQSLPVDWGIDLLNVSFEGAAAPDRITAAAGLAELHIISPQRRWRLVEVDADMKEVDTIRTHVLSLISPSKTHMDFNIGTALWLAASGQGVLHSRQLVDESDAANGNGHFYRSKARVVLVGAGADEQCGGYGRHRTKFKLGGWTGLQAEMQVDVQRIWKRNLGRDDRCIGDHGKEARFPFLDEDVVATLLDLPLWDIADLRQPQGKGDKKILREVASLLGIRGASSLPKRAIQFGSRIARESNKKDFGSNRAANLASAGSANVCS